MSHPIFLEVNILINTIITQSYLYNVYCITQRLLCISYAWSQTILLLCQFHLLKAIWDWLWKASHKIEHRDRPNLLNLFKKIVYAENSEDFNTFIENMKCDETYNRYENFKEHTERKVLPRYKEWSLNERIENSLPNHNQNTPNYV